MLLLSSKAPVAIVHYPDSDKVQLSSQAGDDTLILRREPDLDYWDGEAT